MYCWCTCKCVWVWEYTNNTPGVLPHPHTLTCTPTIHLVYSHTHTHLHVHQQYTSCTPTPTHTHVPVCTAESTWESCKNQDSLRSNKVRSNQNNPEQFLRESEMDFFCFLTCLYCVCGFFVWRVFCFLAWFWRQTQKLLAFSMGILSQNKSSMTAVPRWTQQTSLREQGFLDGLTVVGTPWNKNIFIPMYPAALAVNSLCQGKCLGTWYEHNLNRLDMPKYLWHTSLWCKSVGVQGSVPTLSVLSYTLSNIP